MNPKQPSSGNRMKPHTLLKFVIPTACLTLAFGGMLSLKTCSIRYPPGFRGGSPLSELDRQAQPHFNQAKRRIPTIAENLSSMSSVSRMCWYMLSDKAALEKYLDEQLRPLTAHCSRGAAVYGVGLDTTAFHGLTAEVGKDNLRSTPVQTVATKQEPETNLNPLDDLGMAIESFKAKMKASFDEVSALTRKVKEAQIAQKQKERDFIQARRAIERIRMAI